MKLGLILLISITGIVFLSLPNAYSQLASDNKYLLQATGFVAGQQTISDSGVDLQFSTGENNNGNTPVTLENGIVSIAGSNYLSYGIWSSTLLRDGKFIVVVGDAQDSAGNTVNLNLFGRLVKTNQDGTVYSFSGKINGTAEIMQVVYSAKITPVTNVTPPPTQTPTQTPPSQNQGNTIQVSIVRGASSPFNQNYFSPSSLQITPGTTIIWINNDIVSHKIESGSIVASRTNTTNSFMPDGKFDSGILAPGQSFQYIVNFVGTETFFDPSYLWMSGAITSASQTTTHVVTSQISILQGASNGKTGIFLSPPAVQITPGSTVAWTNNDSVVHRILSGYLSTTTQGQGGSANTPSYTPSYIPDGKIDTGNILPGQTLQITITGTGTTTFYDPSYSWIHGQIVSASQITTQNKPIQVSILPGSYLSQASASQQNQYYTNHYYDPTTIQLIPGTTIIWTNNDSVPHTVLSGISTQKVTQYFTPDGKINSGILAPGQTFQYTITESGIIRFYDPSYMWMNGIIVSVPPASSKTIAATSHNPTLH